MVTPSSPECRLDVSVHAVKNKRRKMEDKHVVIRDLNALFGLKVSSLHMITPDLKEVLTSSLRGN